MVIMGAPVLKRFKWNGAIFLGDLIHKKIAFHVYLGRMYILQIIGNVDKKMHYLTGLRTFLLPTPFSQVYSTNTTKFVEICAVWVTRRHSIVFLKSGKQKSNFSQIFEWQEIMRRKTNKSYDKIAVQNDPGHKKKNCTLDSRKCYA